MNDMALIGVWMKVLDAVLEHRPATMIKVFKDFFTGDDLFGLTESNIAKAIESLSGAREAVGYRFLYEKLSNNEVPVTTGSPHPSGSARTEPRSKRLAKT